VKAMKDPTVNIRNGFAQEKKGQSCSTPENDAGTQHVDEKEKDS